MGCDQSNPSTNNEEKTSGQIGLNDVNDGWREIFIENKSSILCLIRADFEKSTITEGSYEKAFETAKSTDISGGVGYGGVEASVSNAKSVSNSSRQSGSWKKAFSGFLQSGFVQVIPGKKKRFAIKGPVAYISVVSVGGERVCINNWIARGIDFIFDGDDLNTKEDELNINTKNEHLKSYNKIITLKQQIVALKDDQKNALNEIENKNKVIKEKGGKLKAKEDELHEAYKNIEHLKERNNVIDAKEGKLKSKQGELNIAYKAIEDLKKEKQTAYKNIENLKKEKENALKERNNVIDAKQGELNIAYKAIEDLKKEKQTAYKNIENLKKEKQTAYNKITRLQQEYKHQQGRLTEHTIGAMIYEKCVKKFQTMGGQLATKQQILNYLKGGVGGDSWTPVSGVSDSGNDWLQIGGASWPYGKLHTEVANGVHGKPSWGTKSG
eukprot:279494_1